MAAKDWGQIVGDQNYKHSPERHKLYEIVFGEMSKCPCNVSAGECRESIFRETQLESETGWDVYVNRSWYRIDKKVIQPSKAAIKRRLGAAAEDLFVAGTAHVCAYPTGNGFCSNMTIACVIINPVRA